jgi:hypothetical protein
VEFATLARSGRQLGLALAALSAVLLSASVVRATPTSKLAYVRGPGAEGCPGEAELRSAVARRIGYDPFFPQADRTVVAQVERTTSGFTALVRIVDGGGNLLGERSLTPLSSCSELVQNLALTISVAIDDLDAATAPPPPSEPEPTPPAEPAPAPAATPSRALPAPPPRERPRPLHLRVAVGAVGGLASAPTASIGIAPAVALRGSWWQIGAEGRFDAPSSADLPGGGTFSTTLLLGSIVPCVHSAGSFAAYGCAMVAAGSFRGASDRVAQPGASSALYGAVGARLGTEIVLAGRLGAYLQLDGAVPTARHHLELGGSTVYTLPPAWVALGLGLSLVVF